MTLTDTRPEPAFPQPDYYGKNRRWPLSALLKYEAELRGEDHPGLPPEDERFLTAAQVRKRYGGVSDMWLWRRLNAGHGPHGSVDLREAIEKSCNTYFYTLGDKLDIDVIHKWAAALGLGELSGIDLPYEVQGLMPSRAWAREVRGDQWFPGETISVAIGQGPVTVTPISMAVMMATVANGGTRITPHLLKAVNLDGTLTPFPPPEPRSVVSLSPTTLNAIRDGLWYVVNRAGTGARARIEGRDVIGKTGTAQVISFEGRAAAGDTDRDLRDHGWFVFAAPAGAPEIAGVVFGEHAEHGSWTAPIAKHVMETYFAKQEGRPLPVLPLPATPQMVPPVLVTIP